MNDMVDAGEALNGLRTQKTMRIGDDADPHGRDLAATIRAEPMAQHATICPARQQPGYAGMAGPARDAEHPIAFRASGAHRPHPARAEVPNTKSAIVSYPVTR